MKHTHTQAIVRLSSRVLISLITILTIVLSFLQPNTTVQAAASPASLIIPPLTRNVVGVGTNNVNAAIPPSGSGTDPSGGCYGPAMFTTQLPPILTKKFIPNQIYEDQESTLTFTLSNPNCFNLMGATFTDALPSGLQVASNPAASTTCAEAIFSPAPGDTSLSFSGGIIPAKGSCTAQVNVTAANAGVYPNTTSKLTTSTYGLCGAPASDTLVVLPRHPSIKLTKEVSTSLSGPWTSYLVVPAETSVFYRLTVENTGDVDLANVSVSDPDVDLSGCSLTTPFTLTTANPIASCTTGALTAHVGLFKNTATAQGEYKGKTYSSTSSAEVLGTAVALSADLAVTKTNGAVCVYIDRSATYTVTVTNNGPDTVIGAKFVDTAGTGLVATGVACTSTTGNQCSTAPDFTNLTTTGITLPSLSMGQFYQIKMTAAVTAVSGTVMNTATVTMPTGITDPTPDNNTAVDNDIVLPPPSADLVVTKTDGVTYLRPNDTTTYIIRILNRGPDPVSGAMFIDTVGAGLNVTGVICSPVPGNECFTPPNPTNLFSNGISLPNLTPGQFYEIRLTATVTVSSGLVTNIATVTMPIGTPDPTPSNNTATDTDTVTTTPAPSADLAVTKTDGVEVVNPNSSTTYTIRVTNNGPDAVTGATLVDSVGTGLNDPAVICSSALGNQCVTSPLIATLTSTGISLPALTPGQFYEIKLTAAVTAVSGSVTNTANVTMPTGTTDLNPSNNIATDTDTVLTTLPADLAVTKDDGVTSVSPNGSTIYTVRITNNGADAVTGATFVDTAGTGLNATGVVCSSAIGNRCSTAPVLADLTSTGISLPALTPGQFYEIKLTATVVTVSGPVTNTATVTMPNGTTDLNPSNNIATDTDTVATTPALYHVYLPFANRPTLESTSTWDVVVGYEDLPLVTGENDFDYNDWSVAIDGSLTFTSASSNLLHTFTLSFIPLSRGGIYDHTFQVRITAQTFNSNGSVEVNLYDKNHNLISKQVTPFYSSTDNTYVIFAKTSEVFPGSVINTVEGVPTASAQRYADFTITFDNPTPFIFTPDYLNQPHGGGLFFDPTMLVLNNGEQIHRGDVRLLSIPSSAYLWPEESIRIDRAYPLVVFKPGNPSDFSFPPSWWTVHNHCVYDGFTCGTP